MKPIADVTEEAAKTMSMLWMRALADLGGAHPAVSLISRAAYDLRTAAVCIQHPGLKPVDCVNADGIHHALVPGSASKTLCGTALDMHETQVPMRGVPGCLDCIRLLTATAGEVTP